MSKWAKVFLIGLFIATRFFVWVYRPVEFSEITYSYMPYAHRWDSGEVPYLEQWYEYPPGTIPLFFLPHLVDKGTLNTSIHLDYLQSYRLILLLVDVGIFILIWKVLKKYRVSNKVFGVSIIYYSLITAKAHHFLYDTMDLTFTAAISLSIAAPIILKSAPASRFFSWLGTFLGIALKYVNTPLALVNLTLERKSWKKTVMWGGLAFLLVWLLPLAYFRSSLQVSLVYHQIRGLQVESAPAVMVATINSFTSTETFVEAYKNYEITGPVSTQVKKIFDVLFPAGIIVYLIYAVYRSFKVSEDKINILRHSLTLLYVFVFMVTAKVLSTPFLLWHIPLLAMLPFSGIKQQLLPLGASSIIIILSMTPISNIDVFMFNTHLFIGWVRTGLFALLLVYSVYYIEKRVLNNKL